MDLSGHRAPHRRSICAACRGSIPCVVPSHPRFIFGFETLSSHYDFDASFDQMTPRVQATGRRLPVGRPGNDHAADDQGCHSLKLNIDRRLFVYCN
jgi:hypothetical protein